MNNKAVLGVVLLAAVLVGLPIASMLVRQTSGRVNTLQKEYDRIRAEGQPLTFEELDAWYERPADNAVDLYVKAFDAYIEPSPELKAKLPLDKESGSGLPPRGQPLPEAARQAIQEHVRLNSRSIALLHEAATHPRCRYPINILKGDAVELPDLARARRSARLLAEQAVLLADTGDMDGAAKSLVTLYAVANSMENEPLLISQLVRVACAQIGNDALKWIVRRAPLNDAELAKLSDVLDPFCNERTFWRAFVGVRCMWIGRWDARMGPGIIATIEGTRPDVRPKADMDSIKKYIQSALFEDDLAYTLHILDCAIEGAKLPPEESHSKIQEATKLAQEAPSDYLVTNFRWNGDSGEPDVLGIIRNTGARDRVVAGSRTAAAALAVKRYQLQNGALPDSLGQVVPRYLPAVPLDPYDGQPLRYRKEPDKFVVYSVSENGRDDGGNEGTVREEWLNGDVTFTVSP